MKIIQPGVLPSEKIYNSICPNCSCVFEFEEAEAVVDKDFVEMPIVKIDCPTCSQPVHEPWKRSA
jgi:hypothetical protein